MANGNGNGRREATLARGPGRGRPAGSGGPRPDRRPRGGKEIDPSRLAAVEKGDLARSVVATGKIQPLTKVEIKSKASGIVKKLFVDYGDRVKEGQVLAELDREQLEAAVREAQGEPARGARPPAERNKVEAEGPDLPFLKSALERARKLYADGLIAPSLLEDADKAYQIGLNKQTAARSQAAVEQGRGGEGAGGARALQTRPAQLDDREPDGRPRALARRRGGRRGQLDPGARLAGHARDDARRRERRLRARQGRRGRHRPRVPGPARAHRGRVLQGQEVRGQGHQDLAARRGEGQRHHVRGARLDPEPRRRAARRT